MLAWMGGKRRLAKEQKVRKRRSYRTRNGHVGALQQMSMHLLHKQRRNMLISNEKSVGTKGKNPNANENVVPKIDTTDATELVAGHSIQCISMTENSSLDILAFREFNSHHKKNDPTNEIEHQSPKGSNIVENVSSYSCKESKLSLDESMDSQILDDESSESIHLEDNRVCIPNK